MTAKCKHPIVKIVAREEDAEFVECQNCGEVFDSAEFSDIAIEEEEALAEPLSPRAAHSFSETQSKHTTPRKVVPAPQSHAPKHLSTSLNVPIQRSSGKAPRSKPQSASTYSACRTSSDENPAIPR